MDGMTEHMTCQIRTLRQRLQAAEERAETAERTRSDLVQGLERVTCEREDFRARLAAAQAEIARLREALESIRDFHRPPENRSDHWIFDTATAALAATPEPAPDDVTDVMIDEATGGVICEVEPVPDARDAVIQAAKALVDLVHARGTRNMTGDEFQEPVFELGTALRALAAAAPQESAE